MESIIYTNSNCIGCNRCIAVCPVISANASELKEGKNRINTNPQTCISCGACIEGCDHNARSYMDDTEQFFKDLKSGQKISVLIAPAFVINYPREYKKILGKLKKLGVNHIINVGFGADITTWAYINYITNNNIKGGISQPCPAIVNYIEHYEPTLISKLINVHSPLMCSAIYAKKHMGITDKLAFISPCIAKKVEIDDPNTKGLVSYNVTFDKMTSYLEEQSIKPDSIFSS